MDKSTAKQMSSLGVMIQTACLWEATARKPGNVHRFRDFSDLTYLDFALSAAAIAPVLEKAWFRPVGEVVLEAIKATRQVAATNTNLGIVLLLTPMAAAVPGRPLRAEMARILRELTVADATLVFEAIRVAQPGGLGTVTDQDVSRRPTVALGEAMRLAEGRDRIAWQYTHDFVDVFEVGLAALEAALRIESTLERVVQSVFLAFLATFADSLIARKHGPEVAEQVRARAVQAQASGGPVTASGRSALIELDAWLRQHRYNPGTSADLTAASLFAALREGMMTLPSALPFSRDE